MKAPKPTLFAIILIAVVTTALIPQVSSAFESPTVLKVKAPQDAFTLRPGEARKIPIHVAIFGEWHINANQPNEEDLIPTELSLSEQSTFQLGGVDYPKAHNIQLDFSPEPLAVYDGNVTFFLLLRADPAAAEGDYSVEAVLRYQACNNSVCLPPKNETIALKLRIAGEPVSGQDQQGALPGAQGPATTMNANPGVSDTSSASIMSGQVNVEGLVSTYGYTLTFGIIFLMGLALNLTPCVYPVIPITLGFFSSQAQKRPGGTFVLATFYVLGMALMYSTLGTVAAMTGAIWGGALQNPLVLIFVAAVLVALAFSMFGYYDITVPSFISSHVGARQGYAGALFMGAVVGIVAAPCVGPVIIALLTFVGTTGNPAIGFFMFFTLAVGLGFPYLILGTMSGAVNKLPMAGGWMDTVKYIFGFILIGMAMYFLAPIIPANIFRVVFIGYVCATGAYLAIGKGNYTSTTMSVIVRTLGVLTILAGIWMMVPGKAQAHMTFEEFSRESFEQVKGKGRPVMIDASADWCIPCRELEHYTFTAPEVIKDGERFHRLKMDLTDSNKANQKLMDDFQIKGVPTIIFFDSQGNEVTSARVNQFLKAPEFLSKMQQVK